MNKTLSPAIDTLFEEGVHLLNQRKYQEAITFFEQVVQQKPSCWEGWNNLGLVYCELGQYDISVKKYNTIPDNLRTASIWFNIGIAQYYLHKYTLALDAFSKAWSLGQRLSNTKIVTEAHFNLGLIYFEVGDPGSALGYVDEALKGNNSLVAAWGLKGRIAIENNDCKEAITCFQRAIMLSPGSNLMYLVWEAYAHYLQAEFTPEGEKERYLVTVIRKLERVDTLADKLKADVVRAHALFFLACFYCKQGDHFTSQKKLEDCIALKTRTPVHHLARELLANIWDKKIRPPWWRWWTTATSPLIRTMKTAIFIILVALTLVMVIALVAHPMIAQTMMQQFPVSAQGAFQMSDLINWNLYLFAVALLIIIILSPSVEQIKASDLEVKVQAPISLEIIPSSALMEKTIGAISKEVKILTSQEDGTSTRQILP